MRSVTRLWVGAALVAAILVPAGAMAWNPIVWCPPGFSCSGSGTDGYYCDTTAQCVEGNGRCKSATVPTESWCGGNDGRYGDKTPCPGRECFYDGEVCTRCQQCSGPNCDDDCLVDDDCDGSWDP